MLGANKIEEGCLAIVKNSRAGNDGKCVTVGKFIGEVAEYVGLKRWEVDRAMKDTWGDCIYHVQEHQLMRIDGGGFDMLDIVEALDSELCT